jgi:ankyrin repeat protein
MSNEFLDAVAVGDIDKVRRLISAGIDVNFVDYSGPWSDYNAAMIAARYGHVEILRELLLAGARDRSFVDWAITFQHEDAVREWTKLDDAKVLVNISDDSGGISKLMHASRGYVGIVQLLVDAGADVDARSFGYEESALDIAVAENNWPVISYLWPLCSQETRERAGLANDPRERR